MRNLTLRGNNSNNTRLVNVYSNGIFTMESGEISGNTGGGVYVQSGTFTMNGGEISGNTGYSGGGVLINGGTFTMKGGKISGNKRTSTDANAGGGGVMVQGGTFRMVTGTIHGSNEDDEELKNTSATAGAAWFMSTSTSPTAEFGTFDDDTGLIWERKGTFPYTFEDTIEAEDGEFINIKPILPDTNVIDVTDTAEWTAALNSIAFYGEDRELTVNVTNNFNVKGGTALIFGGRRNVNVTLQGEGRTLTLSDTSTGNILRTGTGQPAILQELTL
jgi:hypothetical protein